ncbi:LPXTG cell wall anchor domain-containing protein [Streptomyces sp. MNU76]|uniref:SpaA isopeptide-forming pilin-related protein n=1 Tax=Streptomyces sp. MNU76 TaxID=2560026 RepID=UPI001E48C206|nr:SpaA isopeptide-forming pilin-related protein [Streptomyces sp. MNU76]MCC9706024.1 LPXTG cell wall anchor domain-containing protein [Streptomyces sp. MNU76]
MHARTVRRLLLPAALVGAVTGIFAGAPAASAQSAELTPATKTTSTPDAVGSVAITKKDSAGDVMRGASFLLLDATGQEAGRGKTDAQGKVTFPDLAPGVYRLKETASGSPLHDIAADQDVIVTPGAIARVIVVDPFKPAHVTLRARDNKTGELLPGATVNIGSGDTTLLTLTTGSKGTATGDLPVPSRRAEFWVKQVTAPAGYDLYTPAKTFTAEPGSPVTVTVTNAKTAIKPQPTETEQPTGDDPTDTSSTPTDSPAQDTSGEPKPKTTATGTSDGASSPTPSRDGAQSASPSAPDGSLARTGADATPWLIGGAGLLLIAGIAAVVASRRRTDSQPQQDESTDIN